MLASSPQPKPVAGGQLALRFANGAQSRTATVHALTDDDATSRLRAALVPYIGVELPDAFQRRFDAMLAPLQTASAQSDEGRRRNDLVVNVYEGMLAVQYHRDRVSAVERESVGLVREAFPGPWDGTRPSSASR